MSEKFTVVSRKNVVSLAVLVFVFFTCTSYIEQEDNIYIQEPSNEREAATMHACQWLSGIQGSNGSFSMPGDVLNFDVWETANALTALLRCGNFIDPSVVIKGFVFLDEHWFSGGGLPESSSRLNTPNASYGIETTSVALVAYEMANKKEQSKKLRDFLLHKQELDGSWKIGYPEVKNYINSDALESFPSVTGFALWALASDKTNDDIVYHRIDNGLLWLSSKQNTEGHWGSFNDYFTTPLYALLRVTLALSLWDKDGKYVSTSEKALSYLYHNQNKDGSWGNNVLPDEPSYEFRTALALITLQTNYNDENIEMIENGIEYLIRTQKDDGRWNGGFFKSDFVNDTTKKEDIYSTALAIHALADENFLNNDK